MARISLAVRWLLALAFVITGTALFADPNTIYGIHSWGDGAKNNIMNGKSGWDVEAIDLSGTWPRPDISKPHNDGFEVIARLDYRPGESVPKNAADFDAYAGKIRDYVNSNKGNTHTYVIGNEMNASWEGAIDPVQYFWAYKRAREEIKKIQPDAVVLVGAVAPWNSDVRVNYPNIPYSNQWERYMYKLVDLLGNDTDGYAIHSYGGRRTNGVVDSDPRNDSAWGFGAYKTWMNIIGANQYAKTKAVHMTEINTTADSWPGDKPMAQGAYAAGWIQKAYEDVNNWNKNHAQKISSVNWFTYQLGGGYWGYDMTLGANQQILNDYRALTANTNYTNGVPAPVTPENNPALTTAFLTSKEFNEADLIKIGLNLNIWHGQEITLGGKRYRVIDTGRNTRRFELITSTPPPPVTPPSGSARTGTVINTGGISLNVRSGAGTSNAKIGSLKPGQTFEIIGESNGWYQIKYGSGTGWVSGQYVSASAPVTAPPASNILTGSVVSSAYLGLNVRAGAGTNYSKIGTVSAGQQLQIIGQQNGWYKIQYGSGTGWVSGQYVTVSSGGQVPVVSVSAPNTTSSGGTTSSGSDGTSTQPKDGIQDIFQKIGDTIDNTTNK